MAEGYNLHKHTYVYIYSTPTVTRKYGHAIIVFDGYQDGLSTTYGAHERHTCGRARDMVMQSKKEDLLSPRTTRLHSGAW